MKSPRRLATHKAVRILDDDGNEASVGEIGAIAILGGMVIAGYWNRPKATADIFTVGGWLKTRDSGCPDADRYVFVHDRVTDMIVPGGGNIDPAEVENAIPGRPGVADAAVISVPDAPWGEAVKRSSSPTWMERRTRRRSSRGPASERHLLGLDLVSNGLITRLGGARNMLMVLSPHRSVEG